MSESDNYNLVITVLKNVAGGLVFVWLIVVLYVLGYAFSGG